jgi:hypothetical protein
MRISVMTATVTTTLSTPRKKATLIPQSATQTTPREVVDIEDMQSGISNMDLG